VQMILLKFSCCSRKVEISMKLFLKGFGETKPLRNYGRDHQT